MKTQIYDLLAGGVVDFMEITGLTVLEGTGVVNFDQGAHGCRATANGGKIDFYENLGRLWS